MSEITKGAVYYRKEGETLLITRYKGQNEDDTLFDDINIEGYERGGRTIAMIIEYSEWLKLVDKVGKLTGD